ncbi:YfhO family protein [Sphaerisporangium rhizosphaerae]|uniref:YfhO family protein n=1 Tax=Sphaerisporangium rhizosphaerae TaxID=2269375 RepID=A0ABW2NXY1_9ACTN
MTAQEVQHPPDLDSARGQGNQEATRREHIKTGARAVGPRAAAAVMAALPAVVGLCAGDAAAGFFPFGATARGVSDLGNQYVPFYGYFWDVLHGHARGDLFVNWASGLGSSYLPDLFYYLASPFSLLVALFPRARVDLAVYVVTVAKIAVAAGIMAWYLRGLTVRRHLRSGAAAVFGAAYGLCGWAVTDAVYNPMWLDGLIAFPLLCLVAEWALAGRRPVLGVVFVAFCWVCDFYTAYFATIGAAVLLLIRLASDPPEPFRSSEPSRSSERSGSSERSERSDLRGRSRGVVRAALYAVLGTGLAAPVVLVVYFAAKDAWPVAPRPFVPPGAEVLLGRLLPGGYQFSSPALYVGTFVLFAALTLPFNPAVPVRARAVWTAATLAVLGSMLWQPTVRIWYAFTSPNGSFYREAFVLCGLLVLAGWTSFSRGVPSPRALAAGTALLAAIVFTASGWDRLTPDMIERTAATAAAGAVLYGMIVLTRHPGLDAWPRPALVRVRRGVAGAALAGLAAVQTVEAAANVSTIDVKRAGHLDSHAAWGPWHERLRAAVTSADAWPAYRTEPGQAQVSGNDPQFVGGEGAQYYSSLTSTALIDTLGHLGFGWTSRGRSPRSLDNPVTDAVLAIGARARSTLPTGPALPSSPSAGVPQVTLTRTLAAPLVTVRPPSSAVPRYGASPFRNQELLLGRPVYDVPDVRYLTVDGADLPADAHGALTTVPDRVPSASYPYVLRATCRPGEEVYLYGPEFSGSVTLAGNEPVRFAGIAGQTRAPVHRLGTVPMTGRLKVKLRPGLPGSVPRQALGCLDVRRLAAAVRDLRATGATSVRVSGHTLSATLPAGSTGTAVVAVPAIRGWTCSLDGAPPRPVRRHLGLLAVPLDGTATSLSCSFTPPGLRLGLAATTAALLTGAALLIGTTARTSTPNPDGHHLADGRDFAVRRRRRRTRDDQA